MEVVRLGANRDSSAAGVEPDLGFVGAASRRAQGGGRPESATAGPADAATLGTSEDEDGPLPAFLAGMTDETQNRCADGKDHCGKGKGHGRPGQGHGNQGAHGSHGTHGSRGPRGEHDGHGGHNGSGGDTPQTVEEYGEALGEIHHTWHQDHVKKLGRLERQEGKKGDPSLSGKASMDFLKFHHNLIHDMEEWREQQGLPPLESWNSDDPLVMERFLKSYKTEYKEDFPGFENIHSERQFADSLEMYHDIVHGTNPDVVGANPHTNVQKEGFWQFHKWVDDMWVQWREQHGKTTPEYYASHDPDKVG